MQGQPSILCSQPWLASTFFHLRQKILGYSMQGMLAITCVKSQMTSVAEVPRP